MEKTAEVFHASWVSVLGEPEVLITDGGPEFKKDFIEYCNQHAICDKHVGFAKHGYLAFMEHFCHS